MKHVCLSFIQVLVHKKSVILLYTQLLISKYMKHVCVCVCVCVFSRFFYFFFSLVPHLFISKNMHHMCLCVCVWCSGSSLSWSSFSYTQLLISKNMKLFCLCLLSRLFNFAIILLYLFVINMNHAYVCVLLCSSSLSLS